MLKVEEAARRRADAAIKNSTPAQARQAAAATQAASDEQEQTRLYDAASKHCVEHGTNVRARGKINILRLLGEVRQRDGQPVLAKCAGAHASGVGGERGGAGTRAATTADRGRRLRRGA